MSRERVKSRNLQREIDDLTEANESLLQTKNLRRQPRPSRDNFSGRRMHLQNNAPQDDLDSIGTEGYFSIFFITHFFKSTLDKLLE